MPLRHWLFAAAIAICLATPALAGVEEGVRKWRANDYAGAVAEWKAPAAAGNRDAQFNLGQAYKLGRGVPADPAVAIDYYRKAAAQGHQPAEANLGWVLFQTGKRQEALPILQRAAGRGDPHSQYLLGVAYFNGDVVPRDQARSYRLMTSAAASGLPQARDALIELDARIPLAERQKALSSAERPPVRPQRPVPASAATQPSPDSDKAVAAPPVVASQWRVQLGAFSSRKAAVAAWNALPGKAEGLGALTPYYITSGQMIRLQAGPLVDRAAASSLCTKLASAKVGCFPIQP